MAIGAGEGRARRSSVPLWGPSCDLSQVLLEVFLLDFLPQAFHHLPRLVWPSLPRRAIRGRD